MRTVWLPPSARAGLTMLSVSRRCAAKVSRGAGEIATPNFPRRRKQLRHPTNPLRSMMFSPYVDEAVARLCRQLGFAIGADVVRAVTLNGSNIPAGSFRSLPP